MNGSLLKWLVPALLVASVAANFLLWNQVKSARKDRAQLMVAQKDIELLREQVAEVEQLRAANQEVEKLRRDNMELSRLRNEVRQAREQAPELEKLRAQVAQLTQQLGDAKQMVATEKRNAQAQITAAVQNQVEAQVEEARSVACINNLKQIALAARIWANENNAVFPPDYVAMHQALPTPKVLVCPSDPGNVPVEQWQQFNPAAVSYQYLLPNQPENAAPDRLLLRCLVHGHLALADGSAHRAPKP